MGSDLDIMLQCVCLPLRSRIIEGVLNYEVTYFSFNLVSAGTHVFTLCFGCDETILLILGRV